MNCYFVMAKMDHEDGSFDSELVERKYPENYPLVPGHVWLVATSEDSSYDVAKGLGLVSGGNEDASGIVVPARGYWGFADNGLWRLLQPTGETRMAGAAGLIRGVRARVG